VIIWKRKKLLIISGVFILIGVAIAFFLIQETSRVEAPTVNLSQTKNEEISDTPVLGELATNLQIPWSLAFLPGGDLLVTERPGRVRIVTKSEGLKSDPIVFTSSDASPSPGGYLNAVRFPARTNKSSFFESAFHVF